MKHLKAILLLVFLTTVGQAQAAILLLGSQVAGNLMNTSQVDIGNNAYSSNVNVAPGTWDRSLYNVRITAMGGENNQTPVPIVRLTALSMTISKTPTSPPPFVFNVGSLSLNFNVEGLGAPVFNAYDQFGNNITGSAGLVGQDVVGTDLTGKGVYEIRVTDYRVQRIPVATMGGAFTVNAAGDQQMVTFDVGAIVEATPIAASTFATTTVVPEPSVSMLFASFALLGFMRRKR